MIKKIQNDAGVRIQFKQGKRLIPESDHHTNAERQLICALKTDDLPLEKKQVCCVSHPVPLDANRSAWWLIPVYLELIFFLI